jgi:putative RecB family exonuclease
MPAHTNQGRITIRPLSFTQISLYRTCPLSYRLQYIDGLRPKEKSYFSFGTTMHSCVEYFFRVNSPPPPSLEALLRYYEQNWLSQGYATREEEAGYKEYGRDILKRFWEIHSADFRLPVALERSFYLDIEGIKLRGFIDRVDKLDSGGLSVIDYKTNKELFTADYLAGDLQLTIYQMAAEQTWKLPVERLTLYHLRSNTACTCLPRDQQELEQTRKLVLEVAENIAQGNFPAVESQLCPCDFPEHCPYYRHLYLTTSPRPTRQELLPGIAAIDAVERYAGLQAQIKELQARLEEARQAIIEYCQKEGLNRVFGTEFEATYRLSERTGFNEAEVRSLLEPEGLWEKVLGFDPSLVKQLICDETVPGDIRDKLESLRQVMATFPQLRLRKRGGEEE